MDIFSRVCKVVANILEIQEENLTVSTVFEDIGADSLSMVEIIQEIEDEFSIKIRDLDMAEIVTIGDFVAYVTEVASTNG